MSEIPPEAYRPVRAPQSIGKLLFKLGYKLRPSGPHAFQKVKGGKPHTATKVHAAPKGGAVKSGKK